MDQLQIFRTGSNAKFLAQLAARGLVYRFAVFDMPAASQPVVSVEVSRVGALLQENPARFIANQYKNRNMCCEIGKTPIFRTLNSKPLVPVAAQG